MTPVEDPSLDEPQVLAPPPPPATPPSFADISPPPPPRRRPRVALLAVPFGALALAAGAFLVFNGGSDRTPTAPPPAGGMPSGMPMMRDASAGEPTGSGPAAAKKPARPSVVRVTVELGEMYVKPSMRSVSAGKVRFVARNVGKVEHELIVRRMTRRMSAPVEHEGLGMTDHMHSMETARFTVHLKPGRYELYCNVPGHYAAGQQTTFRVTS